MSALRRAAVNVAAPALLRTQARAVSVSAAAASPASAASAAPSNALRPLPGQTAHGTDNPLMGGLGVSALARPAGRQSVSGIVATVFGCSGHLGRYVVNHLGRIGSQVITPYRSIDGMNVRHLKLAGDLGQIVPIPVDIADMDSVRRAVARSNVVINLIGSRYETHHYSFDDVHAKIPYRLAQVSKAMGVERFIHVSAVGADAKSDSDLFRSKAAGEEAVKNFYPDATIIRPTVLFGPVDRFLAYYAYMAKHLAAIPMTQGGQRQVEPVFVGDVALAIMNSIADPAARGKTYELGGTKVFTEQEIIDLTAKHTVQNIRTFNMPDSVARLYGSIIGGRRDLSWLAESGLIGAPTIAALASKLSFPSVFNADMVAQKHTDLVSSRRFPGLDALGVQHPVTLEAEIERILAAHRAEPLDHFPEAEIMKRDAKDNASF